MEINSALPLIDWTLALKLSANKQDLAEDMLAALIQTLPEVMAHINKWLADKNIPRLLQEIHKLHGTLCYCGLPRLKIIVVQLETELKNNTLLHAHTLINQLESEVNQLLAHYAIHHVITEKHA